MAALALPRIVGVSALTRPNSGDYILTEFGNGNLDKITPEGK